MLKPIRGTWFEFQHHNIPEGKYWNPICRWFTDEQWEAKVDEIAELGMKYIVLLTTAQVYEDGNRFAYFNTDIYPFFDMGAKDPMGALLRAAERNDIKVFVSCGYYGSWNQTRNNMVSPEVTARAFKAMEQLYAQYGQYKSFYGWYLPDETGIYPYYEDDFIKYVNTYSAFARTIDPKHKMLIAPYGTNHLIADDKYIAQLESIDCDIIAYQDEIGVRKSKPEETPAFYEALRKAHDKAGRAQLWADIELFDFEGVVYKSALLPSSIERIGRQIENVAPYCDKILCYQYLGIMNPADSEAFAGHSDSAKLYEDYKKYIGR